MARTRAYTKPERKEQIRMTLLMDIQRGVTGGRTMYKIARALDMRPSSHLLKIIQEMVEEGTLEKIEKRKVAAIPRFVYTLKEGTYTMPELFKRKIRLNLGTKTEELEIEE